MKRIEKYRYVLRGREENVMGVVIGKMDGQVEKIFLGNNVLDKPDSFRKTSPKQQRLLF